MVKTEFQTTIEALVTTLANTFKQNQPLQKLRTTIQENTQERQTRWFQEFQNKPKLMELLRKKNILLFVQGVPVLLELQIPQLWIQNQFSKNSKSSIWQYLLILAQSSKPQETGTEFDQLDETMNQMLSSLPPEMAQKMKALQEDPELMDPSNITPDKISSIMHDLLQGQNIEQSLQGVAQSISKLDPNMFASLAKLSA